MEKLIEHPDLKESDIYNNFTELDPFYTYLETVVFPKNIESGKFYKVLIDIYSKTKFKDNNPYKQKYSQKVYIANTDMVAKMLYAANIAISDSHKFYNELWDYINKFLESDPAYTRMNEIKYFHLKTLAEDYQNNINILKWYLKFCKMLTNIKPSDYLPDHGGWTLIEELYEEIEYNIFYSDYRNKLEQIKEKGYAFE